MSLTSQTTTLVESTDQTAIRAARTAQNQALAAQDIDHAASFWTEDITIRRALGQAAEGVAAARQIIEPTGDPKTRLIYQRATSTIEVSTHWPLAFEEGKWTGQLGSVTGPIAISGRYAAQWVKRAGRWLIRSEVFVALACEGVGCGYVAVL